MDIVWLIFQFKPQIYCQAQAFENLQNFFERKDGDDGHGGKLKDDDRYKKWQEMYKAYTVASLSKDQSRPSLDAPLLHNSLSDDRTSDHEI